jgi:hypothetical protein
MLSALCRGYVHFCDGRYRRTQSDLIYYVHKEEVVERKREEKKENYM